MGKRLGTWARTQGEGGLGDPVEHGLRSGRCPVRPRCWPTVLGPFGSPPAPKGRCAERSEGGGKSEPVLRLGPRPIPFGVSNYADCRG